MPFTPNTTTPWVYTGGLNVSNWSPNVAEDTIDVYVNSSTGSDTNHGSSVTDPFLTLGRALESSFMSISDGITIVIHLAGTADHILADGYTFPMLISPDQVTTYSEPSSGLTTRAPLIIRATPVLEQAIPEENLVSQGTVANSGLKTIVTNFTLVADYYIGMWVQDQTGLVARIYDNDTTTLYVDFAGDDTTFVPPLLIQSEGATIAPADTDSTNPTVLLRAGTAPVLFFAVEIFPSSGGSVQVASGQQALFVCSRVPSLEIGSSENTTITGPASVECKACALQSFSLPNANLSILNSYSIMGSYTNASPMSQVSALESSFQGMVSALFSDGTTSPHFVDLQNCLISDSSSHGIRQIGGILNMNTCDVASNASAGIRGERQADIKLTTVTSSAVNTGSGVSLAGASVCQVNSSTNVTATTAILVGQLSMDSFASFRHGSTPYCFAASGDGSFIYQTSAGGSASVLPSTVTTTPYTVQSTDAVLFSNATAGAKVFTLPPIASFPGKTLSITKTDSTANTVTLTPDGVETINGAASKVLSTQWDGVTLVPLSTNWVIVSGAGGGSSPTGPVTLSSSLSGHDVVKTFSDSPYTVLSSDLVILWNTAGGNCSQPLPAISTVRNRFLWIAKNSTAANNVTIDPSGAETINGLSTLVLSFEGGVLIYAPAAGTDWQVLGQAFTSNSLLQTIQYQFNEGGGVLTTGIKAYVQVPFACVITAVTMGADQTGSIVIDIWKDTFAAYPPTIADTITASAKPTISAAIKSNDSTLTGWTTTINQGDWLAFNIDSASTVTFVTMALTVRKL